MELRATMSPVKRVTPAALAEFRVARQRVDQLLATVATRFQLVLGQTSRWVDPVDLAVLVLQAARVVTTLRTTIRGQQAAHQI